MPTPTLELSIIVRNAASTLAPCLASVAPLVDRILVGDTGSSDRTAAIARSFGAHVVSIPWSDDFAAARNQLLTHARHDWILVLDADERLDTLQAQHLLPALLKDPDLFAYTLERWDYVARMAPERPLQTPSPNPGLFAEADAYPGYTSSFHTRLFRRDPRILFRGCVHEQVTEELDRHQLPRASAPLVVHHLGYVQTSDAALEEKIRWYHRLAQRKAAQQPDDFEAQLQLGAAELTQMNNPGPALAPLRAAAALNPRSSRAHLLIAICHLRLQQPHQARTSLARAQALGECSPSFFDTLGDTFLQLGVYSQAVDAYKQVQAVSNTAPVPVLQAKIGVAATYLGHSAAGLALIRQALKRAPHSPAIPGLLALAEQVAAAPVAAASRTSPGRVMPA